jgi:excisionase family DNA binding protein
MTEDVLGARLFYTREEAAEVTRLSKGTIDRYLRSGELKAKRSARDADGNPAGKVLISRDALMEWFEGLEDA